MEPILSLRNIQATYGKRLALQVAALDLYPQEVLAVIGPNGTGKSTLLQVMAGLRPWQGDLCLRGQPVRLDDLAYCRRIALVLQSPMLLDLSVLANVTLGLRFRGVAGGEANRRAMPWLERLGVAHLAGRPARALSGGEAQRVSLARALVLEPEILLLDEPFSALDAPARAAILDDFRRLLRETRTTTVFVTHDQDEALQLGDRVAVLLEGRLRQVDAPERVFSAPADEDVAAFVGVETMVAGRIVGAVDGLSVVQVGSQQLEVPAQGTAGDEVLICLRPEDVTLMPADVPLPPSSARNRLRGQVTQLTPHGRLYHVTVDCGFSLIALITPRSRQDLGIEEGRQVVAAFKASAIHVIRRGPSMA